MHSLLATAAASAVVRKRRLEYPGLLKGALLMRARISFSLLKPLDLCEIGGHESSASNQNEKRMACDRSNTSECLSTEQGPRIAQIASNFDIKTASSRDWAACAHPFETIPDSGCRSGKLA